MTHNAVQSKRTVCTQRRELESLILWLLFFARSELCFMVFAKAKIYPVCVYDYGYTHIYQR